MKLLLLFLGLSCGLFAEEAAAPVVNASETPQVADPQLQEAAPLMRQGADEPLGGFSERGRKGMNAAFLGYEQVLRIGVPLIGLRFWFSDNLAFQAGIGGSYGEFKYPDASDYSSVNSNLLGEVGFRYSIAEIERIGFVFADLRGAASQSGTFESRRDQFPAYIQVNDRTQNSKSYGVGLRLGAELFWPGSKRVSLEASGGLTAAWTQSDSVNHYWSSDGLSGTNSKFFSSNSSKSAGLDYSDLLVALNLYY